MRKEALNHQVTQNTLHVQMSTREDWQKHGR